MDPSFDVSKRTILAEKLRWNPINAKEGKNKYQWTQNISLEFKGWGWYKNAKTKGKNYWVIINFQI